MKPEWNHAALAGLNVAMRNITEVCFFLIDEKNSEMTPKEIALCLKRIESAVASVSNTEYYFKFALNIPLDEI
jgi:hypothetical protein